MLHVAFVKKFTLDAIRKRVLDPEEDIRKAAVIAICEAAKERPDVISVSLLKDVGDRMRDKKVMHE